MLSDILDAPRFRRLARVLIACVVEAWGLLCSGGCGEALPPPPAPVGQGPVRPRTQRDPLPHRPVMALHPATGEATGVALLGGHEQARRVAIQMVHAMLQQDSAGLRELFAPRVVGVRSRRMLQRRDIVAECLAHARQLQWHPDRAPKTVVELNTLQTRRVAAVDELESLPEGLRPADVAVRLALRPTGPPPPARCFQRSFHTAQIYVRPGPEPRIVAVYP